MFNSNNNFQRGTEQKQQGNQAVYIPAKDKADLYGANHIFKTCAYCRVFAADMNLKFKAVR